MKYEIAKSQAWLASKESQLPGLNELLQVQQEVLIIGAAVFELYAAQGWTDEPKRRTGDIDLSIGILSDADYETAKAILIKHDYRIDVLHPYRFHPPIEYTVGFAYIDLLAHPKNDSVLKTKAQAAMGVGEGFDLSLYEFAKTRAYPITASTLFPNPFGLMSLKAKAYQDEPNTRKKDFGDIIECVLGLVKRGTHFDMREIWDTMKKRPDHNFFQTVIQKISNNHPEWDVEEVESDLQARQLFIDPKQIRLSFSEFNEQIFK